jgi:hypothetical protein
MFIRIAACMCAVLLAGCDGSQPSSRARSTTTFSSEDTRCRELPELVLRVNRGYVVKLSPDIGLIPAEPNYIGVAAAPVHSGPWDYLAHVPLLLYGPNYIEPGRYTNAVDMTDLAPTVGRLIGFRMRATDGRALFEGLLPNGERPRLIVTVVWDGGGDNVLGMHSGSWPFLKRLSRRGAWYPQMVIGSSPSVTPPIHATLATGVYPNRHGIPGLRLRTPEGEYLDPFLALDPSNLRVPTLADLYDKAKGNRPITGMLAADNWHLGMIGHGASWPGGDRDIAVLFDDDGVTYTNRAVYALPGIENVSVLQEEATALDAADGTQDGEWRGHDLEDPLVRASSPAQVAYQGYLLRRLIESGGFGRDHVPDLLYVNFKPLDDAGHMWGLTSPEMGLTVRAQDTQLRSLVSSLDRAVGKGRWVLMLTADHGFTPYPDESGAWPIGGGELARDANEALDRTDDGVDVVDRVSSPGAYVNREQLRLNDLALRDVAQWMADYTVQQNLKEGEVLPKDFEGREGELLFDAAVAKGHAISSVC